MKQIDLIRRLNKQSKAINDLKNFIVDELIPLVPIVERNKIDIQSMLNIRDINRQITMNRCEEYFNEIGFDKALEEKGE